MNIRICFLISLIPLILFCPTTAISQSASIECTFSDTHLSLKADARFFIPELSLYFGAGAIDNDHKYEFYDVNISVRDNLLSPVITAGLGLKEIIGDYDEIGTDYDMLATSFFFVCGLDLRKHYYKIPISLIVDGSLAPSAMCRKHTEKYADGRASLQIHMSYNLALVAKYTYIEMELEKNGFGQTIKEDIGLVGVKIYF